MNTESPTVPATDTLGLPSNLVIAGWALVAAAAAVAILVGNAMRTPYLDESGDLVKIGFNWLAAGAASGGLLVAAVLCLVGDAITKRMR